MKTLSTVAMYGLVPVPPVHDAHAFGDNDDQPPKTDDANAALLAWYRHTAAGASPPAAKFVADAHDLVIPRAIFY
jgi:hypothetical protein